MGSRDVEEAFHRITILCIYAFPGAASRSVRVWDRSNRKADEPSVSLLESAHLSCLFHHVRSLPMNCRSLSFSQANRMYWFGFSSPGRISTFIEFPYAHSGIQSWLIEDASPTIRPAACRVANPSRGRTAHRNTHNPNSVYFPIYKQRVMAPRGFVPRPPPKGSRYASPRLHAVEGVSPNDLHQGATSRCS